MLHISHMSALTVHAFMYICSAQHLRNERQDPTITVILHWIFFKISNSLPISLKTIRTEFLSLFLNTQLQLSSSCIHVIYNGHKCWQIIHFSAAHLRTKFGSNRHQRQWWSGFEIWLNKLLMFPVIPLLKSQQSCNILSIWMDRGCRLCGGRLQEWFEKFL